MASVRVVIQKPINASGGGVQSVNGDGVNNTDPLNPVLAFPNGTDVLLVNEGAVTVTEAVVDLQSTKADLALIKSNVIDSNTITFTNVIGNYFGTYSTPRTGALTFDNTNAVTGGVSIVYYINPTLDISGNPKFGINNFKPNEINKLYVEIDSEGVYTMNVISDTSIPDSYIITVIKENKAFLQRSEFFNNAVDGDYLEFKMKFPDFNSTSYIMGNFISTLPYFRIDNASRILIRSTATSTLNLASALLIDTWYIFKLSKTATGYNLLLDGNNYTVAETAVIGYNQILGGAMRENDSQPIGSLQINASIEYIDFNGDMLTFTNNTGTHYTQTLSEEVKLLSQESINISTLYEVI